MKKSRARRINSAPLPCITSSFTPREEENEKNFFFFFFFFCFLLFFFFFVETKHKNSKKAKIFFSSFFKKKRKKQQRLHKKKEGGEYHTHLYSLIIIYMHACICGLANGLGVNVATELSLLLLPQNVLKQRKVFLFFFWR